MLRFTQQQLVSWGGQTVYDRAAAEEKNGSVFRADIEGDIVKGILLRNGTSEIHTGFKVLKDGSIESRCPCPTNRDMGTVCHHVVALGIALMKRYNNPERERLYREELRHAKHMEELSRNGCYLNRSTTGPAVKPRLRLPAKWTEEFWSADQLDIELDFRSETGAALLSPDQLSAHRGVKLSTNNDLLISIIEDICEGYPKAKLSVSRADFLSILGAAFDAEIVSADGKTWRLEKEPVSSALMVDIDEESGELLLYPKLDLPVLQNSPAPAFLVNGRVGVAVTADGKIVRLRNTLPLPYHSLYRETEIIPRSRVMSFIKNDLPNLKKMVPTLMQIRESLFECIPAVPRFSMELNGSPASIQGILRANYHDQSVVVHPSDDLGKTVSYPDPENLMRYYTRNREAEIAARRILVREHGFEPDEYGYLFIKKPEKVLSFLGRSVPALGRKGWRFTYSPKLAAIFDSTPTIMPVVNIKSTDERFFDVGFKFEAPGGELFNASEVQGAVKRGEGFVRLNGKTYLFDTDAVENMRAVFSDCRCRESPIPGYFRMPQLYAPFVHSSLVRMDGIDLDDPSEWRERVKLSNREGNAKIEQVPLGDKLENTLRPYQKEGVYWMRFLERSGMNGLLADEMGLGKTLQTLTWLSLERCREPARGKPAMVICPTSLVQNWNHEAEKFVPHLRRLVINGPNRDRLFDKIAEHDLIITSYALIRRDFERYQNLMFSAVVLDEAQHIKNRTTQNAKAVKLLRSDCKLVLTGTPIENSVSDIWSIMDFLMPEYLGDHDEFRLNYEDPLSDPEFVGANAVYEKLRRKLHPFLLRRVKKDVAKDLPDKIVKIQYCGMSPDQKRCYDELLGECRSKIKGMVADRGFDASRFEILALLMQMRQICCHLHLLKDRKKLPGEAPSEKLETFFEIVDNAIEEGHRILVFSQFVSMLQIIRRALEERGMKYCYLDGQTTNRLEQCQLFNLDTSIPVFLISLKAGGTGLNLTGANIVVHFDPWWNPAVEDQATDRAHRIGQTRTVYSIKMITADSIEERVLEMQHRKQDIINATINASDSAMISKLSYDDIKRLIDL